MEHNGVILLFFDLPSKEKTEQALYRKFMKRIKNLGYIKLQESVYVRLQRNSKTVAAHISALKNEIPKNGNVLALPLTVGEFSKLMFLGETSFNVSLFCDDVVSI